ALVSKNLHALIGDFMEHFSVAVLTQVHRLMASNATVAIELQRLFAPSLGVLKRLSPSWHGIQLVTASQAEAQNLKILAVNSGNLRNGLTAEERATVTRQNYQYANLLDEQGRRIGSTSPRVAGYDLPNHGRVTLIAAPADHPEVLKYSAWKHALANKLDKASQGPTIPLIAVACAVYNLEAQIVGMKDLLSEKGDGSARFIVGLISAVADLSAGIGNLTKSILDPSKRLVGILASPSMRVPKIFPKWRDNLIRQTGSSKLPLLRLGSGIAMAISSAICLWDAKRAWHQGDQDAALAYGAAAAGGGAWTAYLLGMSINPIVLVAGALLFIGASILAGWLVDSDIEALLKNGPFGSHHGEVGVLDALSGGDARFAHLHNPKVAYQQLLGVLGKPAISAERFVDWWRHAPNHVRKRLDVIDQQRESHREQCLRSSARRFAPDDWVVSVHSPLFSMFDAKGFQLYAREDLAVLPLHGAFNTEHIERREIDEAKLIAYPLDSTTFIYILPNQFPMYSQTSRDRFNKIITHRLKVVGQFWLIMDALNKYALMLPQPSPKAWQPFQRAYLTRPAFHTRHGEAPYWHIETLDFKV
ncbi:hypothetical protein HAQ04_18765, partial [Pseudomonas sp. C2L11]|nr:hypothetical protein [Pseudomonas typographi]